MFAKTSQTLLHFIFVLIVLSACSVRVTATDPIETLAPTKTKADIRVLSPTPTIKPSPSINLLSGQDTNYILLAWFYKPPINGDLHYLANHFDIFILTKQDEMVRDALSITYSVETPILRYVLFDSIMDPGPCEEQPYRNQVADQIGDYCFIAAEHPDWFLLDINGNLIRKGNYVLMDPGNPEWQRFWLNRVIQNQKTLGWKGVFLDNIEAGFAKRSQSNTYPAKYETPEAYQAAIAGFLDYISSNYFKPQRVPLFGNVLKEDVSTGLFLYLQYLDGIMVEAFAVDWNDGYLDEEEWIRQINMVKTVLNEGKHVILVSQGDSYDIDRQRFAFASYLLVTNGNASFRYTNSDHYNEINTYLSYSLMLGEPVTGVILEGDEWVRYFDHGKVSVNPAVPRAIIELD